MLLRPASATWFELLVAREELASVLRCLATTGQVELQSHTDVSAAHLLPALRGAVDEYKQLARRYAHYWPPAAAPPVDRQREPEEIAQLALKQLRSWAASAEPIIARLQELAHESADLGLLRELLSQSAIELPDLALFRRAGPLFASRLYLLPPDTGALGIPPAVLVSRVPCTDWTYLLTVGPADQIASLEDRLAAMKARRLDLPADLPAAREAALAWVISRLAEIATTSDNLRAQLAQAHQEHGVGSALADFGFIEWLVEHVPELAMTEHFAWLTGWTSDASGARIAAALERAHVQHLLRFPTAPYDLSRPVVLRNPRWAQPFEMFARLLGMPAASEADPSPVVALIAPVMFGFMFADVGQGAVLLLAGVILRRRYPPLALLIPGGVAAIAFGFLFGSMFAREDLVPALWLHPMDEPLTLLIASLAFGVCVILSGLLLDAIQHYWSRQAQVWWAERAGLVVGYLALVGGAVDLRALWALPAGLAWAWIGASVSAPRGRMKRLGASAGESIETLLQLCVNTISFVRVGAFSLAHAGLAAALDGLAGGLDSRLAFWLALALGNLFILLVEGLVVGIQTTRLVLFEFFIRFLRGSGRAFRPLPLPSNASRPL